MVQEAGYFRVVQSFISRLMVRHPIVYTCSALHVFSKYMTLFQSDTAAMHPSKMCCSHWSDAQSLEAQDGVGGYLLL